LLIGNRNSLFSIGSQPASGQGRHNSSCSTADAGSATQTSHTTTLPDEVTRQITITDPTHPLFGQIFPLVQPISPQGPASILIQLPNGRHRAVPRAATDLDAPPQPRPTPTDLPLISVRTILPLAHRVRAMVLAMEDSHAAALTPTDTDQPATCYGGAQRPASALAAPESAPPAATGRPPRRLDPARPHRRSDNRGGAA
jgi:hypothetical protein